ncbi:hypothetical protein BV283P1_00025 [Phocaeicola phage BV283P1]|nr:hypothetical protein BV283P1_00025 [Phocaeicola phage BV283P1]
MNGINLKGFEVRSFMIKGLTAKWGIGENRVPPIWDNNLIGYWDARDLPNGAVSTITNKATLATKAPDLIVNGATMVRGTLQFDGVDDKAYAGAFVFPEKYTVFWDIDWLGMAVSDAGIYHSSDIAIYNRNGVRPLKTYIKGITGNGVIPNTSVGLSTNGNVYAPNGSITPYDGVIGTSTGNAPLFIANKGTNYTQMGFRQLLIFNKELSPKEVAEVLAVMYNPTYAEDFMSSKWTLFNNRAMATATKSEIHVTEIITDQQFIETSRGTYANKMRVRVDGISGTGKTLYYRYDHPRQRLEITEDGIYTLPQGVYNTALDGYNGFQIAPVGVCDITIAQLPT